MSERKTSAQNLSSLNSKLIPYQCLFACLQNFLNLPRSVDSVEDVQVFNRLTICYHHIFSIKFNETNRCYVRVYIIFPCCRCWRWRTAEIRHQQRRGRRGGVRRLARVAYLDLRRSVELRLARHTRRRHGRTNYGPFEDLDRRKIKVNRHQNFNEIYTFFQWRKFKFSAIFDLHWRDREIELIVG